MEIRPAQLEADRIGEPLFDAEPAAAKPGHPDLAVDALRGAVGDPQHNGIKDAPQMVPDHSSSLLDQLQATAHGLGQPPLPALLIPGPADRTPE